MVFAKKKILIAEDELPMARALELKFTNLGFDTIVVFDGQMAIEKLSNQKFDLVLLDLIMPHVDGFGVLEAMKKKHIQVPVIVSTNLSQEDDVERAKKLGAKDYFVKSDTPITEVVEHAKRVLNIR